MEEEKKIKVVQKKYTKGDSIITEGDPVSRIGVLMSGSVTASYGGISLPLQPGTVIGLSGVQAGACIMNYCALEDVLVYQFGYTDMQDFIHFFNQGKNYRQFLMFGSMKEVWLLNHAYSMGQVLMNQCCQYVQKKYKRYRELCEQIGCTAKQNKKLESAEALAWDIGEAEELRQYFIEFSKLSTEAKQAYFEAGNTLCIRYLRDISSVTKPLLQGIEMQISALKDTLALICADDTENIYTLYMELLKNKKTPKDMVKPLLGQVLEIVSMYGKVEQTAIGKLHLNLKQNVNKYWTMYETISEYYQNPENDNIADIITQAENADEMDNTDGLLGKLLDYAGSADEFCTEFRECMDSYKNMKDKSSTDNEDRIVRKKLTNLFYELYQAVFFKAEEEERNSKGLRLFLNFGIVDETMFDPETLDILAEYGAEESEEDELPIHVYTIRQWLHEIYVDNKEPSRNEFDQDYQAYLRELYKGREAPTPEEEERMNSPEEKVKFEIQNFFIMNNRLTSGHLLSFCPVLSQEDLNGNVAEQLMTAQKVNQAFRQVLDIDFSVFYRDVMYDDRENGIQNLIIHQEILPDIIFMPNAGTLGRMWQEISGKKRATPGRFTIPVLLKEDINKVVPRMIGTFRWEICKRVQGNYWNDVSEPSLTAEFCDYIQFYKKNRDLSDKAKEKIGQLLAKCRNNYCEVFVNQYTIWVTSESAGNVRLDKVCRFIFGRYCPFVKSIRVKLMEQPMFTESINRYERDRKKHLKELNNRRAGVRNRNGVESEEFQNEFVYFEL